MPLPPALTEFQPASSVSYSQGMQYLQRRSYLLVLVGNQQSCKELMILEAFGTSVTSYAK